MSMIYFSICILFLFSTISAISSPKDVYSAVIYTTQNSPVDCKIIWLWPTNSVREGHGFEVTKDNPHSVHEKIIRMGDTWDAHAVINEVHCGNLVLKAPFEGVYGPSKDWKFLVESDKIVSLGPN